MAFALLFLNSKDPYPPCREGFSHLIYTDLRDDKILDHNWLKLANWLRSHIPDFLSSGKTVLRERPQGVNH